MRDPEIADAVARLLPRLAPAAVLLTDDPGDAVRLLGEALGAPRAVDDPAIARRALARRVLRPSRWSGEQVLATTAPVDDDVVLAEALRALPARDRAAAVLLLVSGLPRDAGAVRPGEAEAAVARLVADLDRRDMDERRERARAARAYRVPGSAPAVEPPPPVLPDRLARLAAGRPLPPTAVETIAGAISATRRGRLRRRLQVSAGVVVATLLVALTPLLPQGPGAPPTVYGGPARGSLAAVEGFTEGLRDAPWPGAATEDRRLVFAGDVPGGRWALVATGGTASRPAAVAWFTGPAGSSPDRMVLRAVRSAPDPAAPLSLTEPAVGALVVVGVPGDRIAVSARPVVGADGSVTRDFRDAPSTAGVAVVALAPLPGSDVSAVRVRVVRDGSRPHVPPPTVVADPDESRVDVPMTLVRPGTPSPAGQEAVESRLRSVLGQLGAAAAATPVTALWSGDLPGPTSLSVLAVEQPSGALVVTAPYGYDADPGGPAVTSWCGTGVLPAGPPLEERVVALRCDIRDVSIRAEISRFLVVVAPRTAAAVRLLDGEGAVLSEHPLDDGVAVVRSPGEVAEVSVTTADGGTATAVPFVTADLTG